MSDRPLVVLVPTRSRPHRVAHLVDAFRDTSAFHAAELYFIIDADDMRHDQYVDSIKNADGANMVVLPTWQPMVPKLNRVAREFMWSHKAIAFMGDDHLPRTAMWAHMLVQRHRADGLKSGIIYGQDGFQNERLPTWWSMDSRVVQALDGRMVPAPVQHLFCDNVVKELGERSGTLCYDERILIEHMHPVIGKGRMDAQYERVNRPKQYESDGTLFHTWLRDEADQDATLVRNVGG